MLNVKDFEKFLDENVSIGVPHRAVSDRLFFYYGQLVDVDKTHAKMKLVDGDGLRLIPLSKIIEIRLREGSQ